MNFKVGDTVKIKSLDWYNANKDKNGYIFDGICFDKHVSRDCGKDATVRAINGNIIEVFCGLNTWFLQEWMLEPKEEVIETKIDLSKNAIIDPPVKCWVGDKENEEWVERDLLLIDHRKKDFPFVVKGDLTEMRFAFRFCTLEDPNIPKESYIPYTYEDFPEFRDCWVRYKDSFAQSIIESLNYNFIFIANSGIGISYVDALQELEVINPDGTTRPFGKKVE